MSIDGSLLAAILRLGLAILIVLLGLVVLVRGRRLSWLFSGAATLLLGILVVRVVNLILGNSASTAEGVSWLDVALIGVAVVGGLAGRQQRTIAYGLVGLATGGALGIWFARLFLPPDVGIDIWSAAVIVLFMGLGMLFVLRYGDVALILLSAGVGVSLIAYGLALPTDSTWVAALGLAAAIAGIVIQYHDYLVELRLKHRMQETGVGGTLGPALEEADVAILPSR